MPFTGNEGILQLHPTRRCNLTCPRSRPGAFRSLGVTTATLREIGVPFGFLFTLTQHNVHQLEWAVGHAIAEGAAMLQIHPLEATGRGAAMASAVPDRFECAVAVLEAARLRRSAGDRLHIQVDLAGRPALPADPADAPLGEIVSPLVVEPDGRCVPLEYGFPQGFALGDVSRAPLRQLAARWRAKQLPRFLELCRDTSERLRADAAPVTSWYAAVAASARDLLPDGGR